VTFKLLISNAGALPEQSETVTKPSRKSQPAPLCRHCPPSPYSQRLQSSWCLPWMCANTDLFCPQCVCRGTDQMHRGPSQVLERGRERN